MNRFKYLLPVIASFVFISPAMCQDQIIQQLGDSRDLTGGMASDLSGLTITNDPIRRDGLRRVIFNLNGCSDELNRIMIYESTGVYPGHCQDFSRVQLVPLF